MSRYICPSCSLHITRSDSTLQCIICSLIYHTNCCDQQWFLSVSSINCCTQTSKNTLSKLRNRLHKENNSKFLTDHSASQPPTSSPSKVQNLKRQLTPPSPSVEPLSRRRCDKTTPASYLPNLGVHTDKLTPPVTTSHTNSSEPLPVAMWKHLNGLRSMSAILTKLQMQLGVIWQPRRQI